MKSYKFIDQEFPGIRFDYHNDPLNINDLAEDPFAQFYAWLSFAHQQKIPEFNAFTLSTVQDSQPASRVVLLKALSNESYLFFSNYKSRKGKEVSENKRVAALFFWQGLERQVRIEGRIEKSSAEISDDYFANRPKDAKIGGIVSNQSEVIESKDVLQKEFAAFANKEDLQRPEHWGGFEIFPDYFEFWQGQSSRMHDRIVYEKTSNDWKTYRLAP